MAFAFRQITVLLLEKDSARQKNGETTLVLARTFRLGR